MFDWLFSPVRIKKKYYFYILIIEKDPLDFKRFSDFKENDVTSLLCTF